MLSLFCIGSKTRLKKKIDYHWETTRKQSMLIFWYLFYHSIYVFLFTTDFMFSFNIKHLNVCLVCTRHGQARLQKIKLKNHSSFVSAGSFQSSIFFYLLLSLVLQIFPLIKTRWSGQLILMTIRHQLKQPSLHYTESADLLSL